MEEIKKEQIKDFVDRVIHIERKYAFELRNVTSQRQQEIEACLNKFITEEKQNADQND